MQNPYAPPTAATVPPAVLALDADTLRIPLTIDWYEPMRVRGRSTRLRDGTMTLSPRGIEIDGRQCPGTSTRVAVSLAGFLVGSIAGVLVAYAIVNGAMRSPCTVRYAWDEVEEVVFDRAGQRVGFVVKTASGPESIVTRMPPDVLAHVANVLRGMLGEARAHDGSMQTSLPKWAPWAAFGGLALAIVVAVIIVVAVS
jgi:hypothetical protein